MLEAIACAAAAGLGAAFARLRLPLGPRSVLDAAMVAACVWVLLAAAGR